MKAGIFNPRNADESNSFERPPYPPKCESEDSEPALLTSGHFLIPITLIAAIPALRLTAMGITYLLWLMSRFNYYQYRGGKFSIADMETARLLNTTSKTIQRERKKLVDAGWLEIKEGGIIRGGLEPKYQRTRYLWLKCPGFGNGKAEPPFFKIERGTFEGFLLRTLGNGITCRHIVADFTARYFEFQHRLNWGESCPDFLVRKGELRGLFGIPGTPKLIKELYRIPATDGEPLSEVIDNHQSLRIKGLRDCPQTESLTPEPCGQETIH